MKTAKSALLMLGLLLTLAGCGEKKKLVPSAAESMEKNKFVRILTDAVNAPLEFGAGTGVQGMDVDIGNEIGKDLGIEVRWVKASGYQHLFDLLKDGEAEILLSAIAVDSTKSADFEFSTPYCNTGDVIAIQRNKSGISGLTSLSGKKVGIADGRPADDFMTTQKTAAKVAITRYPTTDDALGALNRAEIDAVVGDEPLITYSSFKSFHGTIPLPGLIHQYRYAVVVRKAETGLLSKINGTIDRLNMTGELKKLDETWFGNVRKDASNLLRSDQETERLKKAPKSISVDIDKASGGVNMDSLDGFVLVFEGPQGTYQSTSIRTEGNHGRCNFTKPVPPGEYRLAAKVLFKGIKTITVPDYPKTSLVMTMKLSAADIEITLR
ncbi:MAG TPA: transporter substrate-binding domain-containing protein [Acidobacteriota bacterium]|nr:transporter substrate-binding domain-containing protein [Acidobacteriota bacterium]